MDYEKWYTSRAPFDTYEEIRAFELQNHINYMYISRFWCGVDLVRFVLACKKSNLGEALLFQVKLPLLEHFVDKNRLSTIILIADNLINI